MTRRELAMDGPALLREQERQRKVNEARRRRVLVKQRPRREAAEEQKAAEMQAFREEVWYVAAAHGQLAGIDEDAKPIVFCCFCPDGSRRIALELMHMEGGVGRRRERQSVDNCGAGCGDCNREWDAHPERRPEMAGRWSERIGRPIPHGVLAAAALKGWKIPEVKS